MSTRNLADRITITSPCRSDWNEMIGNDQVRFCRHCNLNVHNLSEMTRREGLRLVASSQGRLCVRYCRTASGELITNPPLSRLHQISRRASRIVAGAFGAAMSISGGMAENSAAANSPANYTTTAKASDSGWTFGAKITGTVTDQIGAVITGAGIFIVNEESKYSLFAATDDAGEFEFTGLTAGYYKLRIEAAGFEQMETGFFLQSNGEQRINRSLRVAGPVAGVEIGSSTVVTMGVMALVVPSDPFVKAAQEDDMVALEALLAEANVNLRDKQSGTTALEHAVENGNREMVQLLLSRGADVNAQNQRGRTVLMRLDDDATSDLVWDLINARANLELKDEDGNTALIEAASYNNLEILRTLLDAGAKFEVKNKQGQTALMQAAENGLVNNVRALVLAGANFNECDAEGNNALSLAVENGHAAVIRFLRTRGALESVSVIMREQ